MMKENPLTYVCFLSYMRMIQVVTPTAFVFTVFSTEGELIWTNNDATRISPPPQDLFSHHFGASATDEKVNCRQLDDNGILYSMILRTTTHDPIGHIFLVVDKRETLVDDATNHAIKNALLAIRLCIIKEYELNAELNAMANELGERYEELHLVYETDDEVRQHNEAEQALADAVGNCAKFLNVPIVALLAPKMRININHRTHSQNHDLTNNLWLEVCHTLLRRLEKSRKSVVLNSSFGIQQINSSIDLPHKLLAAPIFDGYKGVCGALIIGKQKNQEDFTNSDRNLLEVIAKKASKIIRATYDSVTGLLTRDGIVFQIEQALRSTEEEGHTHCLLHLEVDHVRVVSDTKGHEVSDEMLRRLGALLRQKVRDTDKLARLGDVGFGLLLEKCPLNQGNRIAENLRMLIEELEFSIGEEKIDVGCSIGLSEINTTTTNAETALVWAEATCHSARERGHRGVLQYDPKDPDLQRRQGEMEYIHEVRRALREDRFEIWAQPIIPLASNGFQAHIEILLRMRDSDGQIVTPATFMPAAERYHLMPAIDRWVIEKLFSLLTQGDRVCNEFNGLIAINLSGQSFRNETFVDFVREQLAKSEFPAHRVCFEITETVAMGSLAQAREFITALKFIGCSFALDDFGSGLSSFSYLKNLPVDYLKIDGEFVKEMEENAISAAMVEAINNVAHVMNIPTIAEFVENDAIREHLVLLGVDFGQGYGLGRPTPIHNLLQDGAWLQKEMWKQSDEKPVVLVAGEAPRDTI